MTWKNGAIYVGDWMNDVIHGNGMIEWGKGKYIGDWNRNRMDGNGEFIYNGYRFKGMYKMGKRHG